MDKNGFLDALRKEIKTLRAAVSTQNGDWTIKGFIDIAKNIYTISTDTKVISKVMELSLFPELLQFAKKIRSGDDSGSSTELLPGYKFQR